MWELYTFDEPYLHDVTRKLVTRVLPVHAPSFAGSAFFV